MVTFDHIIERIKVYNPQTDVGRLRQAFEYAERNFRGMYNVSGDTLIQHALGVANHLLDFRLDDNSVVAALLHDVVKCSSYNPALVSQKFGADVFSLISGMDKLKNINLNGGKGDFEAFRRMVFSLAQDLRLILIRFADLLDKIESIDSYPLHRRKEIALEMLEIYAPIASRLGIYSVKCRFEDFAFQYLYPDKFLDIQSQLEVYLRKQEKFLEYVQTELQNFLQQHGIAARVEGRLKNLYSIYRKMKRKSKSSLSEIFDIFAFRIILPDCSHKDGQENTEKLYTLLGVVHNHWVSMPERFKDYVASPKPNGYRSLHTTLVGDTMKSFEQPFEVQIRSERMHQQAEFGIASHWLYEDTKNQSIPSTSPARTVLDTEKLKDQYRDWLDGLVHLQKNLESHQGLNPNLKLNMFKDHIFVFTPEGAVKDLPKGASPVDFAYAVHTDLGHRCQGAKVNGSIVPLDYELKNGDRVEILTKNKLDPKLHWLSFVKSSHAKNKIKGYLKSLDFDLAQKEGKEMVNKFLVSISKPQLDDNLSVFRRYGDKKLTLKEREGLLIDVGNGALNVATVVKKAFHVQEPLVQRKRRLVSHPHSPVISSQPDQIFIAGQTNVPYKLSSCCNPQEGDHIVGYVTRGNAIRIHQQSCRFLTKADSKRVLEASFGTPHHPVRYYPVHVDLKVADRVGLIRDIADVVAGFNVNILDFSLKERNDNLIHRHMVMEVSNQDQFEKILAKLKQVRNVLEVSPLKIDDQAV